MLNKISLLIILTTAYSCSNRSDENNISSNYFNFKSDSIAKEKLSEDSFINNKDSVKTDSIKIIDSSEILKQGEVITRNRNNTIISIKNYTNDTLDGYYFSWRGMQEDGYYKMGKKHGYFRTYYDDKKDEKVMLITHYRNDTLMWHAHPFSDEQFIYNPKGFKSLFDSIYIKVPRLNGKLWYEGLFIQNKEVGKHTIYKKSGDIYAIADYDKSLVYFPDNLDTIPLAECGFKKIEY